MLFEIMASGSRQASRFALLIVALFLATVPEQKFKHQKQ
jgi:hypothetical protein